MLLQCSLFIQDTIGPTCPHFRGTFYRFFTNWHIAKYNHYYTVHINIFTLKAGSSSGFTVYTPLHTLPFSYASLQLRGKQPISKIDIVCTIIITDCMTYMLLVFPVQ